MWELPGKVLLLHGNGQSEHAMLSFDRALRACGIADLNLIRVTSILPPYAHVFLMPEALDYLPSAGRLTSSVYSEAQAQSGQWIACAIGCGIPEDPQEAGVLFEHSGPGRAIHYQLTVEEMVRDAFDDRKRKLKDFICVSSELMVEDTWGTALCCAVLVA